jgi:protein-disulfide isomerase
MHDVLFAHHDSLGIIPWDRMAKVAKVRDIAAFDQCLVSTDAATLVADDRAAALKLGAAGTPTLLINGLRINGAVPQQLLDSLVDAAIRTAKDAK